MDKTLKPASSRAGINETTHRSRRNFDDRFKAMVVLEALREDKTMNELAAKYDVHPNQISLWKNESVKNASSVFSAPRQLTREIEQLNAKIGNLHRIIGEKDMDIDFLKKTGSPLKSMVDKGSRLSVSHQCALLEISRNAFYYRPQDSQETLLLMRLMDGISTDDMTAGQRKIRRALWNRHGVRAGRDRIRTLMERMNIHPVCPKPDLSFPKRDDHKFPYLLQGVKITHANQVWSTDITYIRLKEGFCYLTAVIDWYSRRILSWRLSNTLSAAFCMECVNEAFGK